jgi:putative hydrolase of the HAD superfamily
MRSGQRFRYLLCDLDDTLYPASSGVMRAVGQLILRYMLDRVGIPSDRVNQMRSEYYHAYGTTMRGLILHHAIDPLDYLAFVHDLPLREYIQPNPALEAMLSRIPLRKAVITNADRYHAGRVLDVLGVRHHFEWIIDVQDFGFNSKPHPSSYERMLEIVEARPGECIMVEDVAHNLAPARAMGMLTVLVEEEPGGNGNGLDRADVVIRDILEMADALQHWMGI